MTTTIHDSKGGTVDDATLKRLTAEMLSALPTIITDTGERDAAEPRIRGALGQLDRMGSEPLLCQLAAHPDTRRWMRDHDADAFRAIQLAGVALGSVGLYYVCPHEDEDLVLLGKPDRPPLCPIHRVPMILQPD